MLLTLFIGGVILWVLSLLLDGAEKTRRKRDLDTRIAEMNARLDAAWKEHDETFLDKVSELYEQERRGKSKL